MTTHELKTLSGFFQSVLDEVKLFELRYDDRGFKIGDKLVLKEYDDGIFKYTGRSVKVIITYMLKGFPGLEQDFVILGIKHDASKTCRNCENYPKYYHDIGTVRPCHSCSEYYKDLKSNFKQK